jgi:signal transduction histidine kinase/HPt (histidine-containing phosphotransfer) domain-containing protein
MKFKEHSIYGIRNILGFCQTLSVLYIEDNIDIRNHTKEMMEGIFDTVYSATNGREALQEFKRYYQDNKSYYDIVLTDIQMPIMDGLEMSRLILEINPKQIIIVNSAHSATDNLLKLIDLGINYFLPKPLHFKELLNILQKVSNVIYSIRITESYSKELELVNTNLNKTVKELKESVDVAKSATKSKDDFFANISHEIRTPMNAIIGLSHLALETDLDEKQLNYITKIKNASDHLLGLVNDLLDFSKIEAGKLEVENIEFNINAILDNVSSMIMIKAQEKGLEVIYDIDNSVPALIKGDPLRLGQVILNLMNNAVKFTESGEIVLNAKMSPLPNNKKLLIFEIIDTGIGLTNEQMMGLFKSFSQADNSISRKYGGTGLGLSISKQLVELMGGNIRVVSEYGKGSRFIFSIVTEQPYLSSYRLPSRSLMFKKVLIIDSNPKTSSALEEMLKYFRYDSLIANNEDDAKLLFTNNKFDILCIDKEIASTLDYKTLKNYSNAKIVLIESSLDKSKVDFLNKIPIDVYLQKPFNQQMIFNMILELFAKETINEIKKDKKVSKDDLNIISGSHILLAEDNSINQAVMVGLLDKTGIKITIANNGEEVVSSTKRFIDIDLILMDINMPIMNGYEATKIIRRDTRYNHIPIIALSADAREEDIIKSKEYGMEDYLAKPLDIDKFYKILIKYIAPKAKAINNRGARNKPKRATKNIDITHSELDIININLGIKIAENNETLYILLLTDFMKLTKKSVIKINALMRSDNKEMIYNLISDIKQSLKKVIAPKLAKEIKSLERVLKYNCDNEEYRKHIKSYENILNETFFRIEKFIKSKEIKAESKPLILDKQDALARIGNKGELYHSILFEFADVFRNSTDIFKELIEKKEFEKAFKFANNIKYTSGNISAKALFQSSQKIEEALQNGDDNILKYVEEYEITLNELLLTIDSFRDTQ